jgi:hypothetical protein
LIFTQGSIPCGFDLALAHPLHCITTYVIASTIKFVQQWWRMNLLQEMFSAEEAKIVTSIPIASLSQPDMRIWRCTANGKFTVKCTYHLVREMETRAQRKDHLGAETVEYGGQYGL